MILKRLVYLLVSSVFYVLTCRRRRGAVVLCYHGIKQSQKGRFEQQVGRLSRQFPLTRITFDDAFANLLDNAIAILSKLKMPAIIFAVSGNFGCTPKWNISCEHAEYNETLMTAQQLKDIQSDLITIGSHTQTHPDLSKLPLDRVRYELTESKKNLEQLLSKPVEDLALPHGAYNQDVLRIAQEAGYKRIYTLEPRPLTNPDAEVIGRFSMSPDVWPIEFYLTCAGAYAWLYPFRKLLKELHLRSGS